MTGLRWLLPGLLAVLLGGCGGPPPPPALAVGATADPQSLVLAHVYAAALRSAGTAADVVVATDPVADLDSGAVDVVPGFTGRLLRTFQPVASTATARSEKHVYRAMVAALPEGIAAGDYATAAEDKPALAVTAATTEEWGGTDLRLLPRHCRGLTVGTVSGDRPPVAVGSCRLTETREFPTTTALFAALWEGRVGAAWTSTADPKVPAAVAVLVDAKPALVQAENVVPLYRRHGLTDRQLLVINEVAGVLDTAALVAMHRRVDDRADPRAVAEEWLSEHPLGR